MLSVIPPNLPLLAKIKRYKKRVAEVRAHLKAHPADWGKFQSEFNQEINSIFRDMMFFEKENSLKNREEKIYKFKRFFMEKLEKDFSYGEYITWSQKKPYGYAGDFKMMDGIYENSPKTLGFDRLFDNYMQMSAIAVGVRNRKDDFRRMIGQVIKERNGQPTRIMSLACGPCREIEELLKLDRIDVSHVVFDCLDHDENALKFAAERLGQPKCCKFAKVNAVKLALKKNIETEFKSPYHFIYSTGLFDYLDKRVSIRLIQNLRSLLASEGVLAISDVRDKYSNPSLHFMQLVGEWDLLYRNDEEFRAIFLEAGFSKNELRFDFKQQGIMQYIFATKTR